MVKKVLIYTLVFLVISPFLLFVVAMLRFIFGGPIDWIFQTIFFFVFGWVYSLQEKLPLFLLGLFLAAFFIGAAGTYLFLLVFDRKLHKTPEEKTLRRLRQSVAVGGILCALTITAISLEEIISEVYLIVFPKDYWMERR